jgi:PAS domain S-box-containing protein
MDGSEIESLRKYLKILENSSDGILLMEYDRFIDCNRRAVEIFGCKTKDEIIGKTPYDFSPPFQPDGVSSKIKALEKISMALREPQMFEWLHLDKDGKIRYTEVSLNHLGGKILLAIVRDITERKEIERKLKKYERFYKNARDLFFMLDSHGRFVDINPKFAEIMGYEVDEIIGQTSKNLVHPEDLGKLKNYFKRALSGDIVRGEFRAVSRNGDVLWFEVVEWPVFEEDKVAGIEGILRDVTDRKLAEMRLARSEARFRELWENANDIFYIHDLNGNFIEVNKAGRERFGYSKEEIKKLNIRDVVDKNYLPIARKKIEEKVITGEPTEPYELLCYTKNGEPLWVEIRSRPIIVDGKVIAVQGVARDITERKTLEKELRESEEKFRVMAEKSVAGIYLIQDGVFKYVNPKFAEIFGYEVEEMIDKPVGEFIHPEDRGMVEENIRKRIDGEVEAINYTLRILRKDGSVGYVEVYGSRAMFGGRPAVIGTLIDITEIVRLNKLLGTIGRINKLMVYEKNLDNLLKNACESLNEIKIFGNFWICLYKPEPKIISMESPDIFQKIFHSCEVIKRSAEQKKTVIEESKCPHCLLRELYDYCISFPLVSNGKAYGALILHSHRKHSENEIDLLQTLASDLAFAIKTIELEEHRKEAYRQIDKNIEQFAFLIDRIRNPLAIIVGLADIMGGEIGQKIIRETERIDSIIEMLEKGWIESEEIREFLRKSL